MPVELVSATETARDFLTRSGYAFFQLQDADFDAAKNQWSLTFDVGVAVTKLKKVVVDSSTGKVVGFESA